MLHSAGTQIITALSHSSITMTRLQETECTVRDNMDVQSRRLEQAICLVLVAVILVVFLEVRNCEFVYDDLGYVTQNQHVQMGISFKSILWAWTTTHAGFWIPLTWLSLMFDHELYGLSPSGYHWTNLLLHIENALLLFLVLRRTTGAIWRSAFVVALFALHPLRVESVAWVTERKDVLSTFFWMLTVLAYLHYVKKPRFVPYVLIVIAFALALMAKPMAVTLPFVLLLMDYWPLGRLSFRQMQEHRHGHPHKGANPGFPILSARHLVLEKAPLIVLAALFGVATFVAQKNVGALAPLQVIPLNTRINNALVSYVTYIRKMIWPDDLAVFYPHLGESLTVWQIAGAALILAAISVLVIRTVWRHPYLMVGWLWYLGTLLPVIGLSQAGEQAAADRFTYVPLVGLFIMIAWGIPCLLERWRYQKIILTVSAGIVLSVSATLTCLQVRHWHNNAALFTHAIDVAADSYVAHYNLAVSLANEKRLEEAMPHYYEALRIKPDLQEAHNNLGIAFWLQGNVTEAIGHYSEALRIKPDYPEAHNNLALALFRQGRLKEAMAHYYEALRIKPGYAEARHNLQQALMHTSDPRNRRTL